MKLLFVYRQPGIALLVAMCCVMAGMDVQAGGSVGTTGFGGARIGGGGGGFAGIGRTPSPSSIIRHGDTGFSIYSQQGVTRVIGTPGVSRNVLLPDGRRVRVIGDGKGGAQTFGPRGSHRVFGNPRISPGDGP